MSFDAVVIGGGVNALTAASYLAKAGRSVAIVCPADKTGGLCARHEFLPGFFSPGVLSDTSMFRPWVVDDLGLENHGLIYSASARSVAFGNDQQIVFSDDIDETAEAIARVSEADAVSYLALKAFYKKINGPITQFLNNIPADIVDPDSTDLLSLFKRGFQLRKLGKKDMLEVLRLAPMAVYDWLDEWFENDGLKASMALPAVTESYSGPWSPGTNANLLIREITRGRSINGDGLALVAALEKAASSFGVHFEDADVASIEPGKGIRLKGGGFIEAKTILAACCPKKVFLELMDPRLLSHTLEQRISKFRTRGLTAQLLLAIGRARSQVPGFKPEESSNAPAAGSEFVSGAPGTGQTNLEHETWNFPLPDACERVIIARDLDHIEKAFDPVKYDEVTKQPCLEIYLPSNKHRDLAPDGHAVISVSIHYTPYSLSAESRQELYENVIKILDEKMPGIRRSVVGHELLTPKDIEERYDLSGGQLYEGEHALDQLLVRPIPECSQYKTPFEGLFLCSGGSFPGGGLTGAPGALAAKMIA